MAKHWSPYGAYLGNGGAWEKVSTTTLASLRSPAKYWVISDAQLKRDLKGRTIKDVYRENRAGREACSGKYVPQWFDGIRTHGGLQASHVGDTVRERYMAECMARNHTPHPASIDSDHPLNCHREKAPKAERITGEAYAVGGMGAMPYAKAMAEASAIHAQSGVFASIEQVL